MSGTAVTTQKGREREAMLTWGVVWRQLGAWGIVASIVWFGLNIYVFHDKGLVIASVLTFAVFTLVMSAGLSLEERHSENWPFTHKFSSLYMFMSFLTIILVVCMNMNELVGFLRGMFRH